MATFLRILLLLTALQLCLPMATSAEQPPVEVSEQQVTEWICPMECEGLRFDEAGDCPVCGMHLVPHKTSADGLDEVVVDKPQRATMPGVAAGFMYGGGAVVGMISLLLLLVLGEPRRNIAKTAQRWRYPRREVGGLIRRFVKWRAFQVAVQLPVVALFLLVIAAGLFGNQDPARNIAPVLTWNIWWMGLIFFAFFAGEVWCTVCPWMALPDWLSRTIGRLRHGKPTQVTLGLPWPRALKTIYPAIVLFFGITWLELVYEAPYQPALTAGLGLLMVLLAGSTLFVFERKGFCRYACLVGRATGAYGTTGLLELRRRDADMCRTCATKDCFHGNDDGLPCPTWEFMGAMNENTNCIMCTECLRTCPHDNVAINVRAPLADLAGPHRKRMDEAWLMVGILVVTVFHGLAMVPLWTRDFLPQARVMLSEALGMAVGHMTAFTFGWALFMVLGVAAYTAVCAVAWKAANTSSRGVRDFFVSFAYVTLPVSLGYHLAHNSLHFFFEGTKLIRLASDPFGWGWDLFGTASYPLSLILPVNMLWGVQIALVIAGQIGTVFLARQTSHRLLANRTQARRALVPIVIFLTAVSLTCLWLLNQPMEMRTAL